MEDTELATTAPETDLGSPGDSAETEAPHSDLDDIRAAVEETRADMDRAAGDTSEESKDASPEAAAALQSPASSEPPAQTAATRQFTEQQAFDRALSLHRAGRTHELPPEVQGQIRKWEADTVERHAAEQKVEAEFDELYLELKALEEEDPAEFVKQLRDPELGKSRFEFMEMYAKAHPEVTLDNPRRGPKAKTEAEIRVEQDGATAQALDASLRAFAEDHGVKDYDTIRASSGAGKAQLMVSVMQAVVAANTAKELPNIRKAERDAAYKEAMAEYGSRIPELSVSGNGRGSRVNRSHDPSDIREAMDLFLAEREN